jgi:phosphatidylglycerol---prolipoprotein diacylglyceryl transferase
LAVRVLDQRLAILLLKSRIAVLVHTAFDLLGWLTAALLALLVGRLRLLDPSDRRTPFREPGYFIALGLGALGGAIFVGSLNLNLAGMFALGHSIAGGIAGGIIAVELYKWVNGITGSTGRAFVAPLAAGIAIGRLGCFFAGLPDYTYGIPTTLAWGVDFGDGIARHPVQLYESAAMLVFLVVYLAAIARGSAMFLREGFYLFVIVYGAQRFAWEFLKPYPKLFGPFNVFHLLCVIMIAYGLVMIGRTRELHPAR